MILFSHVLFGLMICAALFHILKLKAIHSPPQVFYLLTLFMMVFPDLDHLYSREIKPQYVAPFTIWDIFRWSLNTTNNPMHFLHYWIYPFMLLVPLILPVRQLQSLRWLVLATVVGWTTHLVLDGIIFFV